MESIDVVVETPRGSRNKYEMDEKSGVIRLDRRLPGSFAFPADYGYVPDTIGSDDEPLDALVLLVEPTFPGVRVRCRPIGLFWIRAGERREAKLVCVPEGEPAYQDIHDLAELAQHERDELGNFFDIYAVFTSTATRSARDRRTPTRRPQCWPRPGSAMSRR